MRLRLEFAAILTMVALGFLAMLAGCDDRATGETYTLYRTSEIAPGLRVHWATFDAEESAGYNEGNCLMAARLLNENLARATKGTRPDLRFWCEAGPYRE